MAGRQTKWSLEDVVDFEALLAGGEARARVDAADRELVRAAVKGVRQEGKKRRWGLRTWLEHRRREAGAGRRTVEGLRLVGVVVGVVAFLAGAGVVRGLMENVEGGGRVFNVWLLLGVAVGLQWILLLWSAGGYWLLRRQSGGLSLGQRAAGLLTRRICGQVNSELWESLVERGRGYHSAMVWRLARLVQGAGVTFNLGLMAGFLGCLWVLKVDFYWESTIFRNETVFWFADSVALPWSWSGQALPLELNDHRFDLLQKRFYEDGRKWWPFVMMFLAVWGLLPRLLMWLVCWFKGRGALAGLPFQEARHRELWRSLHGVQREVDTEGPADGVVLLDVGGNGVATEALREFLLRVLRVNPEARYEAGVLDAGQEVEAWQAIRKAPLGVVFLVEGWALSPKQMDGFHARVREAGAERPMHVLVLGSVRDGRAEAPTEEDFAQWKRYVDALRDPLLEVVAYRELETVVEG